MDLLAELHWQIETDNNHLTIAADLHDPSGISAAFSRGLSIARTDYNNLHIAACLSLAYDHDGEPVSERDTW